jgi:hypothetical protein
MIDFFQIITPVQREANLGKVAPIPPVIFFGHASARHSVGSTMYCAGLGECKKTAFALQARYTALAAITIPILCTVPAWESVKRLPLLYRHGTRL